MSHVAWCRPVAHSRVPATPLPACRHLILLGPLAGAVHASLVRQGLELAWGSASPCMSPVSRPRPVAPIHALGVGWRQMSSHLAQLESDGAKCHPTVVTQSESDIWSASSSTQASNLRHGPGHLLALGMSRPLPPQASAPSLPLLRCLPLLVAADLAPRHCLTLQRRLPPCVVSLTPMATAGLACFPFNEPSHYRLSESLPA